MPFPTFDTAKPPLRFDDYPTNQDMLQAVLDFVTIDQVFFKIVEPVPWSPAGLSSFLVEDMRVPPGTTNYIKTILADSLEPFESRLKAYLQGDESYSEILESLNGFEKQYRKLLEKYDIENSFTFEFGAKVMIYRNGNWMETLYQYLNWQDDGHYEQLRQHFKIRHGFLKKAVSLIHAAINTHSRIPKPSATPYRWNSENAELEISELIYALYRAHDRLVIDEASGASFAKFKKDFFGLFGLSDSNYNKKVLQIQERKLPEHFLTKLAENLQTEIDTINLKRSKSSRTKK